MEDISYDIYEELEMHVHFYFPAFFNKYRSYPEFKEQLTKITGTEQRLVYSISYNASEYSIEYHSKVITWSPTQRFIKTVADYNLIRLMKRDDPVIDDIKHLSNDSDINNGCYQSIN